MTRKTLSGARLPEPENAIAAENLANYKLNGYKVLPGWDRSAPYVDRLPGTTAYEIRHRTFLDHLYRIRVGSNTIYVTEPYGLSTESMTELVRLAEDGWHVCIGQSPLWYPGATVPVLISKRPEFVP